MATLRLAVFVSGRGSNLRAIVDSNRLKGLIKIVYVVSDKVECPAFGFAREQGIKTIVVGKNGLSFDQMATLFEEAGIGLIVLAGFLKLIPRDFVERFEGKIINIHPALLPNYGGKGMYGHFVHEAVFAAGDKVSGPTVHFVNSEYDRGSIIAQRPVDISDAKSPEEIAALVLKEEHKLLPEVIYKFSVECRV